MKFAAGIVTYYPELSRLSESINRLDKQVDVVYIVNNTPKPEETFVNFIYGRENTKIKYFTNDSNVGLAKALNQLCEMAIDEGYNWLLLLDQDSLISDNFILNIYKYIDTPSVGLFCSNVIEDSLNINHKMTSDDTLADKEIFEVTSAITSGSFINLNFYKLMGGFYEDLFIDGIDNDYSRLLTYNGYKIYCLNNNFILHEYGSSEETYFSKIYYKANRINHPFFIRRNYSKIRVYYQFRNSVILYKRWKKINKPPFYHFVRYIYGLMTQTARFMLVEKNRIRNLVTLVRGLIDGLLFDVKKVEAK